MKLIFKNTMAKLHQYKMEFLIIIFSGIYLSIILQSDYFGDDMLNCSVRGAIYSGQYTSIASIAKYFATFWFMGGRLYPLSFFLGDYVFYIFKTLFLYKLFLVVITLINSFLFSLYINKISKNNFISQMALLIYPIILPISFIYDSPYIAYNGLVQFVFFFLMLSLLSFHKYIYSINKRMLWCTIAVILYLCALMTYEVAYLFLPLFIFAAYTKVKTIKKALVISTPILVLFTLTSLSYFMVKTINGTHYNGVQLSLSFQRVGITYLKQLLAMIPGSTSIIVTHIKLSQICHMFSSYELCLSMIFCILFWEIVKNNYKENNNFYSLKTDSKWQLFIIGIVFMLLPPLLISVSARYQQDIQWGTAWLPIYFQSFGLLSFILLLLVKVLQSKFGKELILFVCIVLLICNSIFMRYSLNLVNNDRVEYPARKGETYVLQIDPYINEFNRIISFTGYGYAAVNANNFYAANLKRKVVAYSVEHLYKDDITNDKWMGIKSVGIKNSSYVIYGLLDKQFDKSKVEYASICNTHLFIQEGNSANAIMFVGKKTINEKPKKYIIPFSQLQGIKYVQGAGTIYLIKDYLIQINSLCLVSGINIINGKITDGY